MNCKKNVVLLITGCINPTKGMPFVKVVDSQQRLLQTRESIIFYIKHSHFEHIVYCDNSAPCVDDGLIDLARKNNKVLEWIGFEGDKQEAARKGKGFGEGEIIQYAINHSKQIKEKTYLVKVTGRVVVNNIRFLTCMMSSKYAYFVKNSGDNCDTRMYGVRVDIYEKYLLNAYRDVNDYEDIYLENVFSKEVRNLPNIRPFIVIPNISGISGSTGLSYDLKLLSRIKRTVSMYRYYWGKNS